MTAFEDQFLGTVPLGKLPLDIGLFLGAVVLRELPLKTDFPLQMINRGGFL
jgi:hypothetical protein